MPASRGGIRFRAMSKRFDAWLSRTASLVFLLIVLGGGLISILVGAFLQVRKAGLGWAIPGAVLAFGIVLVVGILVARLIQRRIDVIGEERYLREKRIRMADLSSPGRPVVVGRTFDRCRFMGPAFIAFAGPCTLQRPDFLVHDPADFESHLLGAPEGKQVSGVVAFSGCTFEDCSFDDISVVGPSAVLNAFRQALLTGGSGQVRLFESPENPAISRAGREDSPAARDDESRVATPDRVFTDASCEDLIKLASTPNLTNAQLDALLERYIGLWKRVEGVVVNSTRKGGPGLLLDSTDLDLKELGSDKSVSADFDGEHRQALGLVIGARVRVIGRIWWVSKWTLCLSASEIEAVLPSDPKP